MSGRIPAKESSMPEDEVTPEQCLIKCRPDAANIANRRLQGEKGRDTL
jgi:hypothetical protein